MDQQTKLPYPSKVSTKSKHTKMSLILASKPTQQKRQFQGKFPPQIFHENVSDCGTKSKTQQRYLKIDCFYCVGYVTEFRIVLLDQLHQQLPWHPVLAYQERTLQRNKSQQQYKGTYQDLVQSFLSRIEGTITSASTMVAKPFPKLPRKNTSAQQEQQQWLLTAEHFTLIHTTWLFWTAEMKGENLEVMGR